ncbi:MAG: quinolinate synthase NadA [Candidatus Levybacteria bacterium]|nr:quinolinate synthase NadA [Candidatus Levybacteria bacterium]
MTKASLLAQQWYESFSRHAEDLYPGRYTKERCIELAEQAIQIKRLAKEKASTIVSHNYLYPEFHEIADFIGDSLGLSLNVKKIGAKRVDFESVFFMGATAKIITGDATRVFVADRPSVIGCSLVFGTDYEWLENWKKENPKGILVTYINSDAFTKSISDYISTSRNTDKIIVQALKDYPGSKILVLPDKFLGHVMKVRALELATKEGLTVDPDRIEVYNVRKGENWAACYVHELIGPDASEIALLEHPDAELMIHPECGCAASCLVKLQEGKIPRGKAYFLSTEQMVERARVTTARKILVATEKGMIYRLRKEIPDKEFLPVSSKAVCRYMKANTFDKLLASLQQDKLEIILCDDCCDPKKPFEDDRVVHIQRSTAKKAKRGIDRMLSIQ